MGEKSCEWKCNVGFHYDGNYSCSGGVIMYRGRKYATLDGASPTGTTSGCQQEFLSIPTGWEIAPHNKWSAFIIGSYPWSSDFLVLADGSAYYTAHEQVAGGSQAWWDYSSLKSNASNPSTSAFKPAACNGRILIVDTSCDPGLVLSSSRDECVTCNQSVCDVGQRRQNCSEGI
jgi:hypothetical protein